jgi:hypothetical protein
VTAFLSLLWHVQQFFHLKFQIPTEMPRRNVTLVKIALHEKSKIQSPNTSHQQLVKITGVPKSTTAPIIQQ